MIRRLYFHLKLHRILVGRHLDARRQMYEAHDGGGEKSEAYWRGQSDALANLLDDLDAR